jgi:hypothetical protein
MENIDFAFFALLFGLWVIVWLTRNPPRKVKKQACVQFTDTLDGCHKMISSQIQNGYTILSFCLIPKTATTFTIIILFEGTER